MMNRYLLKTVFISILCFPLFTPAFIWADSNHDTAWLKTIMVESTGERVTINDVTIIRKNFFSPSVYKVSYSFLSTRMNFPKDLPRILRLFRGTKKKKPACWTF